MKRIGFITVILFTFPLLLIAQQYIADFSVAKEEVLRSIPEEYINKARNEFKIAYQHTSHGTHVSYGLFGLQDYQPGDDVLFGITNNNTTENKLDFHDNVIASYAGASDLSSNETAFIQGTRDFLDDPDNIEINVIMWSWCSIEGHNVTENYLPGMQTLIDEYGVGGSRIGDGEGQRSVPVHFIFMTGHAETYNIGDGKPKNQAGLITNYCNSNSNFCLDYYSIDTHDMYDNYWDDTDDNGASSKYGGNFYEDFQNAHSVGDGYYENKMSPNGSVVYGDHNTQHITANRKAYAMWWILARLAGWNGLITKSDKLINNEIDINFSIKNKQLNFKELTTSATLLVYDITGSLCMEYEISEPTISLQNLKSGIYIIKMRFNNKSIVKKIIIE